MYVKRATAEGYGISSQTLPEPVHANDDNTTLVEIEFAKAFQSV